jgi:hypothetical protein
MIGVSREALRFAGAGSLILSWGEAMKRLLCEERCISCSFWHTLLRFYPLQENAFARANAWAHPEYRELLASNEIIYAPPVFLMAEQELRDFIGTAGCRLQRRGTRGSAKRRIAGQRPAEAGERFQNCRS